MRGSGLTGGVAAGLLALVCGCETQPHNNVLVFATETKLGVDVSREAAQAPGLPALTLGYKRREAVWLPLVANEDSCQAGQSSTASNCRVVPTNRLLTGDRGGTHKDSYSVLASFGADFGGGRENDARGALAQFFATGVAAQRLAENRSVSDVLSVQPPGAQRPAAEGELVIWRNLTVAPEDPCSEYSRDDYRRLGVEKWEVKEVNQSGCAFDPFDEPLEAFTPDEEREAVRGRVVAPSEAHESGLCNAAPAIRKAFRSDVRNYVLMTIATNGSKGGRDATGWLPRQNQCWYAQRVVEIRQAYGLTVDQREADILEGILAACESTEMQLPATCPR